MECTPNQVLRYLSKVSGALVDRIDIHIDVPAISFKKLRSKSGERIIDYTRCPDTTGSAAIDPVFNVTEIINEAGQVDYPYFWTGTTHVRMGNIGGAGAYISFGRGMGCMDGINAIHVHGAGCQRSDPKDGNPDDYPSTGNGPQGDVQHVFNFVRLVRDVQ